MIQIASSQLGCSTGDVTCYCREPDFGYGVRDCANEACPSNDDAQTVIAFGTQYYGMALQSYQSTDSGSSTPAASAISILSSAGADGASSGDGNGASSTATVT